MPVRPKVLLGKPARLRRYSSRLLSESHSRRYGESGEREHSERGTMFFIIILLSGGRPRAEISFRPKCLDRIAEEKESKEE